jgi:hypothetical protein
VDLPFGCLFITCPTDFVFNYPERFIAQCTQEQAKVVCIKIMARQSPRKAHVFAFLYSVLAPVASFDIKILVKLFSRLSTEVRAEKACIHALAC